MTDSSKPDRKTPRRRARARVEDPAVVDLTELVKRRTEALDAEMAILRARCERLRAVVAGRLALGALLPGDL